MIAIERAVRFEEVDAAGILFFGRFFHYCHEAMESFFEGAYVDLITRRRIGFPAVHVSADYRAPVAFGDVVRIEGRVAKLGTTSVTFRYDWSHAGRSVASIEHVAVATNLDTMTKLPLPDDLRALLEKHVI